MQKLIYVAFLETIFELYKLMARGQKIRREISQNKLIGYY